MTFLADIFGPITADLLETLGQPLTFQGGPVEGSDAYDPATGSNTASTPASQSGFGVVLEYSTFIRSGVRNQPSDLIRAGDRQLLLSPLDASGAPLGPPKSGDKVTASGVTYQITSVAPLAPAGDVIYFECNIRGAK